MRRNTSRTGDPFQDWLQSELQARDWSYSKLAREIDVFKGTVSRWLAAQDDPAFRRPSIESYRRLADVFGVDPLSIMAMAGVEGLDVTHNLSPIKRDIMSAVIAIPDDLLISVYPQLRALMDEHVQATIRAQTHHARATATAPASEPKPRTPRTRS